LELLELVRSSSVITGEKGLAMKFYYS